MKLDLHFAFNPGVADIDFNCRNAQINTVHHTHTSDADGSDISTLDMNVSIDPARCGRQKSIIQVRTNRYAFTFCPLDLLSTGQMDVQAYGVTITTEGQPAHRAASAGLNKLQEVEQAPEESFETAALATQDVPCVTVLGIGLDYRQFIIDTDLQSIRAVNSIRHRLSTVRIPVGRGKGVRASTQRHLDQGTLPILRGQVQDEDIRYDTLMFTTFAGVSLVDASVQGTPYLVAEEGLGMPHTPEQEARREQARQDMRTHPRPPLMLCYRLRATNTSTSPAYAFFYQPRITLQTDQEQPLLRHEGVFSTGNDVRAMAWFEGQPWPETQIVVLLAPGETMQAEYRLLHEPVTGDAGQVIGAARFDQLLADARNYWQTKLDRSARLAVPETRIDQMLQAGLLHLYSVIYGERDATLAPCVGVYSPIGSESSPIIQYIDSSGWHDIAQRCLQYFLDKQHDDGRFQNFGGYMLETGAALYTMGEHYRYTRDDAWVRSIKDQVVKACGWIIHHHREDAPNAQPGAGLIMGKVADPEDHFRQYMLNAYQYIGLTRAAEMLQGIDPPLAGSLAREAADFKDDIRAALAESIAHSPLVPLGNGQWIPSCAPWVEAAGPDAFALDGQLSFTHEAVYARDSLLGPLYTVFCEIVDPREPMADFLVESHYEHMCQDGVAFSQPYYSRHPFVHLRRGEVNAFLRSFYRAMAALADRQTYTFWEHLFGVSPHKTHEEGWFLMEARNMLYAESHFTVQDGGMLQLMPGVPRAYLRHGQRITVTGAKSYYGDLNYDVQSRIDDGSVEVDVNCPEGTARKLSEVIVRLPHPDSCAVRWIDGDGHYDPRTESVSVKWPATNHVHIVAHYEP